MAVQGREETAPCGHGSEGELAATTMVRASLNRHA
jgi:hypothetical protein